MAAPALKVQLQGVTTVSSDNLNTYEQTCDTIAQLRGFVGADGVQVFVRGFTAINDGGAGAFYWDDAATGPDNGTTVIVPTGSALGAWIRIIGPITNIFNVISYGATGNGTTDDTAAIQAALTAAGVHGGIVLFPAPLSYYKVSGILNISANTQLVGAYNSAITFTSAATAGNFSFNGSNSSITGLNITRQGTGAGAQGIFLGAANLSNISIERIVYNSGSVMGAAIQFNETGATNLSVTDCTLTGGSYGVLANSTLTGSGLFISGNIITGVSSDCVEINTRAGFSDVTVTNNLLDATSGEFGVGVARGNSVVISGNHITGSANHAIHVEDGSTDIVICDNLISGVASGKNGIDILQNSGTQMYRIIVEDNTMTAAVAGTGVGIDYNSNVDGIAFNTVTSGNVINGFGAGIWCSGYDPVFGNQIIGATTGIFSIFDATPAIHDNTFKNVTTVYGANTGGIFGSANITGTLPTNLVVNASGQSIIKGVTVTSSYAHPGGGAAVSTVLPTPALFTGFYSLYTYNNANNINRSLAAGQVIWDGTTFTAASAAGPVATKVSTSNGTVSAAGMVINGTGLQVTSTNAGAITVDYKLVLEGDYIL